jgi:hypothetical protein
MEERIQQIEDEISNIKYRNLRVEADKAWETSNFRFNAPFGCLESEVAFDDFSPTIFV